MSDHLSINKGQGDTRVVRWRLRRRRRNFILLNK